MDLIFNLRIWKLHFQIERLWSCKPMFAWYDFWVGIFFDTKKVTTYIFPIPMLGIKIVGFAIYWNSNYSFRRDPFIWLFQFGKQYHPMRGYDSWMHSNAGGVVSNLKTFSQKQNVQYMTNQRILNPKRRDFKTLRSGPVLKKNGCYKISRRKRFSKDPYEIRCVYQSNLKTYEYVH